MARLLRLEQAVQQVILLVLLVVNLSPQVATFVLFVAQDKKEIPSVPTVAREYRRERGFVRGVENALFKGL